MNGMYRYIMKPARSIPAQDALILRTSSIIKMKTKVETAVASCHTLDRVYVLNMRNFHAAAMKRSMWKKLNAK